MTKGYLIFAHNSNIDYVRQAIALAASLKISGNLDPISLVTNNVVNKEYRYLFDQIIPIPWGDSSKHSMWKVENRWKLYHISPYEHTIVMDSDMLVTVNLKNAWDFLINYELFFTSQVYDFKSRLITDTVYRKTFIENSLPNVYVGFHYFKKSNMAKEFYQQLEDIVKNYEEYYSIFTPKSTQKFLSIDVSSAIAVKMLGIELEVTCSVVQPVKFIHMKPKIQSLTTNIQDWITVLDYEYSNKVIIGNHIQNGVVHYVTDQFLTDIIFNKVIEHANN